LRSGSGFCVFHMFSGIALRKIIWCP
jgi:hypothetical protein